MSDVEDLADIICEAVFYTDFEETATRIAKDILATNYVIPKRVPDGGITTRG